MKIPTIALMLVLLITAMAQADTYEVLVMAIAEAGDSSKIDEFEKDAGQLNGLQRRGYTAAKPYFNLLRLANGQVYLVFGFRGEVQGIHRHNYTRTVKNLERLNSGGRPKYPGMHWLTVAEIRRLISAP